MFYSVWGELECLADSLNAEIVEIKIDDCLVFLVEPFDETVELIHKLVWGRLGNLFQQGVVEPDKGWRGCSMAFVGDGGVECHTIHPGADFAVVPELTPALPQPTDYVLVEILHLVGLAVGKGCTDA